MPAYNSADTIAKAVEGVFSYIPNVIVVDDGSSDRTGEIAESVGAAVVRLDKNRGKGAALSAGFNFALEAGYDIIITLDSDGQHNPKYIPAFLNAFHETRTDLIIGSRITKMSFMPWDRRFSNWATSHILSALLKKKIEDSQSGYRLYSERFLRSVQFESQRFEVETEAIIKAVQGGFSLQFIPITVEYIDGFPTHMNRLVDTCRWCRKVLELI
jgi:glycosyltransferase involved in cell wall biosynthesis